MARARNIKPGFFRNADLVELPMAARLLFIGLWTLADRAGRLEDRPKQIKMDVFPADSVDCDALLDELAATGMIERYTANGAKFLQVVNFAKHQNPHRDEKASILPDRDGHVADSEPTAPKHRANTVQAPCKEDATTVAIGLTPDSLIPDSLIPDTPTKKKSTAAALHRPDDVTEQVWIDWQKLRKGKRAAVSETVISEARTEAEKAGLPLDRFLAVWCARGSQGLEASWLKPHERAGPIGQSNSNKHAGAAAAIFDYQQSPDVIDV